jgi:hypothetical protein
MMYDYPNTTTQLQIQGGALLLIWRVTKFNHLLKCLTINEGGQFYLQRHLKFRVYVNKFIEAIKK